MFSRRSHALLVTFVLLVVACGGGSESDPDPTTTTQPDATTTTAAAPAGDDTTTTTTAPAETMPPDDGGDPPSGDVNKATITVGDATYVFDVDASVVGRCDPDFFGAFWVIASTADGAGNLEMFIVPEGNTNHEETSKIKVGVENIDERDWRADADGGEGTPEGVSSVDSFEIDGNTVTGTASFVDIYIGDDATAQGTFTATCA